MLVYFYLFVPLFFLSGDASSIRGRNNKNELVPFRSSEVESRGKESKLRTDGGEPFFVKLRMPTPSDAKQTKEWDKKRQRFSKKRLSKQKHLKKKRRARRDLLDSKLKPIRVEKSDSWENRQSDNGTDHQLKDIKRNPANRVEVLRALSSLPKRKENRHFKDEHGNGTQKGKHGTGSNRNHPKHVHSPSDQALHVKMIYPATPKTDRHKYTNKDLIADRKRLEQKINYIKNLLSINDSVTDDPIRIRRRSESDRTANKIAKMFLTLSAMNGLHDRRKSKCKYGEEDEGGDKVQDFWEKEWKNSPTRKSPSANEERYKVKKWIESLKKKRSSGKTCPCMTNERGEDNNDFPLEKILSKDYFLMERGRSSEESSEIYRDPCYSRDKLTDQRKWQSKGQEDQDKMKEKNGKKKLELPLNDLELYRSRAKQILQNAEEILDRIKYEEERRLSAPNILMSHLKELTSRIQSDPRNNENDLIRKIQKNLGWAPLSKSKESTDNNGFADNVKSYILDPFEKAKAITDESTKMLSSYLLRNLGKMMESSEEKESDQTDQVYFGRVEAKQDEKPMVASLAKEADPLSKNKEELQNWEDTVSKIMTGAEEAVQTEQESANNREIFKNRMEDIIKEQQKKVTDYEISHQNSEEAEDLTINLQQNVESANSQTPGEKLENIKDNSNTNKEDKIKSINPGNLMERSEDDKGNLNGNQEEEVKSSHIENPSEELEKDEQTSKQHAQSPSGISEENKNDQSANPQEGVTMVNPESFSERLEENRGQLTANQHEKVELMNHGNQRDETEENEDRKAKKQEEVESANPENPTEESQIDRSGDNAEQQKEVKSKKPENSEEDRGDQNKNQSEEVKSANPEYPRERSEKDRDDPIANLEKGVKSENADSSKEGLEHKDDSNAEVESVNPENPSERSEEDDRNKNQSEEVKSANQEYSWDGSEKDRDDPTANLEEEVKSENPDSSREGSKEDKSDRNAEVESSNPENFNEGSKTEEVDENAEQQEEVKSASPEHSSDGSDINEENPTANQEEDIKSANPDNSGERSEQHEDDSNEEIDSANQENPRERIEEEDRNKNQWEEVKSANPEYSRDVSEEDKSDTIVNQEEDVKSANPDNSREGSKEDKGDRNAEVESANPENFNEGSHTEEVENAEQQEEVKSGNPKSEHLGPNDPETDKIENPLTIVSQNTQEKGDKEIEEKKSNASPKDVSFKLENDNPENIQELGKEILDEIIKKIGGNSDSLENEGRNSQENPQTVSEEEENEQNRVGESPKVVSEETPDKNLSSSRLADDYDMLDETPDTGGNLEENSNETIVQKQKPLEVKEGSLSEEKATEDNSNLWQPSEHYREIANLENDHGKDSPNVEETQRDLEEISNETEVFLENANPNEDNLKPKEEDQNKQTSDEAETRNQQDNQEVAESEPETVSENEKDDETLESTVKQGKVSGPRYLEDTEEYDNYIPLQASNIKYKEKESQEDSETPLREVLENHETNNDETQEAENAEDQPSDKNDEANVEMAKDETDLKERMSHDELENDEAEKADGVQETLNETPQQNIVDEEESDEDKTVLQKANPNDDGNDDAQNSNENESVEKARDEENSDEDEEGNLLKSINTDKNHEAEALSRQNGKNQDEGHLIHSQEKPEKEYTHRDKKPGEETSLRSAEGDQIDEHLGGALPGRESEENEDTSEENKSGQALKAAKEYINQENDKTLKSANQDDFGVTLNKSFDEEDQKSPDESLKQADELEDGEAVSRAILKDENNSKKESSTENADKTEESLESDVDGDVVEIADPKKSVKDHESPETDQSGETLKASLKDSKSEQTENLEEEDSGEETPLRSALGDQTEYEPENPPRGTNSQEVEETSNPDSGEKRTEETRADITDDDSSNQSYLENKHEFSLKSEKSGESEENLEWNSEEGENLGSNLIMEENEKTPLRKSNSEEKQTGFPNLLQKPQSKAAKLKIPQSIGQIMKDLNGKEDVISVQNLNPDKIDDIIYKIDEAKQQNLLEDDVDCKEECACADEINTRSRKIGRYEIAKDFLQWMKELQLNRVFSDD